MTKNKQVATVQIKKLADNAVLPAQMTDGAAGFDLTATGAVTIESMQWAIVPTGLAIALPVGYEAQIRPRSGLALKHGVSVLNTPGTIDSDYRGELRVILFNMGPTFVVSPGDRIAQLVIQRLPTVEFVVTDQLDETKRGADGFGSSGR